MEEEEEAESVLSEGCNLQVETCITVSTRIRFLQSVVNEQTPSMQVWSCSRDL